MRKYIFLSIALLQGVLVFGQGGAPEMKTDLPTIIPPSPTVAGLMKFEEVPVSNYTGIPDVSIPLFSTIAKYGLNFNMSLSYHPGSIKKDDVAGFTGLGWSLMAGGTISRTVRDIPDEFYGYIGSGESAELKIGLYHTSNSPSGFHQNNYYNIIDSLPSTHNFNHESEEINRFLFETAIKNRFDSKHDLYQFNFMGYSGRFIIEKKPNGSFEVVKLDKNNLIINYNATNKTFTVKDTNGFTYVFDVKEESASITFSHGVKFNRIDEIAPTSSTSYTYISAFQLSKIFYNQELVVEFIFNTSTLGESQKVVNTTYNTPIEVAGGSPGLQTLLYFLQTGGVGNLLDVILPLYTTQLTTTNTWTKKIKQINVIDRAIIDIDILTGLTYTGAVSPAINHCLDAISIKDLQNNVIKSYKFNYLFQHKLFLDEIKEGIGMNQISKYRFKYKDLDLDYGAFEADYWGYYRAKDYDANCSSLEFHQRDADILHCTKDVLQQIIYPTGGSAIFEFESNNYSYIGDDDSYYMDWSENNFDANPYNWTISDELDNFTLDDNNPPNNFSFQGHNIYPLFSENTLTSDKILIFTTSITEAEGPSSLWLSKINPANNSTTQILLNTSGCPGEFRLESGFKYSVDFHWMDSTVLSSASISFKEKTRNPVTVKAEYGGGIRVKNIYYTTDDTPEISTQEFPDSYSKKISYDYNFFDVPGRSSGSLVYPKPKLQYYDAKRIDKVAIGTVSHIFDFDKIYYSIFSTSNNLSFISTKGSDVGYKNVTVSETGNGRTQYTYLSPIDHPEYMHSANVTFPFAGTPNIDYKRGHLTLEEKYDETGRILNQTTSVYDFEDYEKRTGINVYTFPTIGDICYDCPYAGHYLYYHYYRLGYLDPTTYCCVPNPSTGEPIIVGQLLNFNVRTCGSNVSDFVTYYLQKEAFGWAKLKNTLTKEYFYDTGNVQTSVENNIAYTYNPNNMQLATQTSQTSTVGVEIEKKIYYTIDNETDLEPNITALRNNNMVETPLKIETFKNGVKLAEQKTIYKDWGNDLLAPEIVQSSKGTLPLENRIRYNLMDTATGNPLEVQQENGTVISYIWGYNKSQPIAKIENATNAQIATAIGMSLTTVNETNIPANLRATLPNAMVTTYTYIPLVGISTITDPKGYTTTYEYDSFGRLKTVKDADGNKLSENTYHYRPQN